MSTCSTAIRRRRQAKNGYRHLSAQQRPRYHHRAADAALRRLQQIIATERRISSNKGKKK